MAEARHWLRSLVEEEVVAVSKVFDLEATSLLGVAVPVTGLVTRMRIVTDYIQQVIT
jgi:hypothetical protein